MTNYPSAGQGILPGVEPERHPMWTPPAKAEGWLNELEREIAKRLTPLDGRPNSDRLVAFAYTVYEVAHLNVTVDPQWVAGFIVLEATRRNRRRPMRSLMAMSQHFVEAIERSI